MIDWCTHVPFLVPSLLAPVSGCGLMRAPSADLELIAGGYRAAVPASPSSGNLNLGARCSADDMMVIFMAFQALEIEVIGLTTIFGNVDTDLATRRRRIHLPLSIPHCPAL